MERQLPAPGDAAFKREIREAVHQRIAEKRNSPPSVASDLAEAQVGVLARCPLCKKPVLDGDEPLDDEGRRWHRRRRDLF